MSCLASLVGDTIIDASVGCQYRRQEPDAKTNQPPFSHTSLLVFPSLVRLMSTIASYKTILDATYS